VEPPQPQLRPSKSLAISDGVGFAPGKGHIDMYPNFIVSFSKASGITNYADIIHVAITPLR
jgi:hypothetical protein